MYSIITQLQYYVLMDQNNSLLNVCKPERGRVEKKGKEEEKKKRKREREKSLPKDILFTDTHILTLCS